MTGYLDEVEYAVTHLLDVIWKEHSTLSELQERLAPLEAATKAGYERAQAIWANAEDPDDVMMGAGAHWETYFGADKERHHVAQDADELKQLIDLHEFSVSSLAGSLLQHASRESQSFTEAWGPAPTGELSPRCSASRRSSGRLGTRPFIGKKGTSGPQSEHASTISVTTSKRSMATTTPAALRSKSSVCSGGTASMTSRPIYCLSRRSSPTGSARRSRRSGSPTR